MLKALSIAKFGGSSLANAEKMMKCAEIVLNRPLIRAIVVSAVGNTTDDILSWQKDPLNKFYEDKIFRTHLNLCEELQISKEQTLLNLQGLKNSLRDQEDSSIWGEILSSELFCALLSKNSMRKFEEISAFDLFPTNEKLQNARVNLEAMKACCHKILPRIGDTTFVTQGHLGRTPKGRKSTLGRGGSDLSATLLAYALNADHVQIWTDVCGIFSADPREVPTAFRIDELSFEEASELAMAGASVLHPHTLIPAMENDIPVYVADSQNASMGGTWIRKSVNYRPLFRAIAIKKNQCILSLMKVKDPFQTGYLAEIFTLLANEGISIDLVTTSEISTAMTLSNPELFTPSIQEKLKNHGTLRVEKGACAIGLIGNRLTQTPGIFNPLSLVLNPYNVRFMCLGARPHFLSFLIEEAHYKEILLNLHGQLMENKENINESGLTRGW